MRLAALESHYFSSSKLGIEEENATPFIMEFMKNKFLPQVFNEQLPDLTTKQQFFFTNQAVGQNIFFHENKISFIQNFNVDKIVNEKNVTHDHKAFLDFITTTLQSHSEVRKDIKFNRISYVIKFFNLDHFDKENTAIIEHFNNFQWTKKGKKPVEFNLSFGYQDTVGAEQINVLTKTSLGGVHLIKNNNATTADCYLKEIDVNTIDEQRVDRFTNIESMQILNSLKSIAHEKMFQLSFS